MSTTTMLVVAAETAWLDALCSYRVCAVSFNVALQRTITLPRCARASGRR